jgi:uncharacterized membrane protein YdjX (TVP38/TMEM64 family)
VAAVVVAAIGGLYAASRAFPVQEGLREAMAWIGGLGIRGYLVFGLLYVLACVLFVPGTVLTLGAGLVFGVVWGTAAVSVASTFGAAAAFLVGRTLARAWVARKVEGNAKFAAIDEAVGREGFKVVLLTRLSPVFPFNLLNYAYGLTKVSFARYFVASWIGMFPGTVMYVYLGSALQSCAALGDAQPATIAERVFFWLGLGVAIVVAAFVGRLAKKAIARAAPGCAAEDGAACAPAG